MANGQFMEHPMAAVIRAQNARSIARRAQVAALAGSVARTDFASLSRAPRRQIGGIFREILPEPAPVAVPSANVPNDLINRFFEALTFSQQQHVVARGNVFQAPAQRSPFGRAAQEVSRRIGFFSGRNPFLAGTAGGI